MNDKELQQMLLQLGVFDKMFDIMRFVDPLAKKVFTYGDGNFTELKAHCFDFWGNGAICDNCISMRAFNENQTFVKVEYKANEIYIITAMPVELNNRRVVIELLKNTTDSMVFENWNGETSSEIYAMIDGINNLAFKDALTGVYNRRYINERLPVDLISLAFSKQSLSVIMADIDFFKKVNDTYGHLTGDMVLKSFAGVLSGCIKRESDWVARFGGEEFLICLPGASLVRAAEIAENMRKSLEETEIPGRAETIKITASFGVYCTTPGHGNSVEDIIEAVDSKLYAAKNNGRNRVEF